MGGPKKAPFKAALVVTSYIQYPRLIENISEYLNVYLLPQVNFEKMPIYMGNNICILKNIPKIYRNRVTQMYGSTPPHFTHTHNTHTQKQNYIL